MTPDQSRAVARLAQTLTGDDYTKLQGLLRAGAHLAEYPSAWQEYVAARVGNVLKYSESQARDERGRWTSSGYPTWDDLSEGQQSALTEYQTSGYQRINPYLRGSRKISDNESIDKQIKDLDSLIETTPGLDKTTTLYRGINGQIATDVLSLKPGDSFTDKAFSSTSADYDLASNFASGASVFDEGHISGVMLNITAPKGTKALDVDRLFDEPFESEFILPRNTKFVVEKVQAKTVFLKVKND